MVVPNFRGCQIIYYYTGTHVTKYTNFHYRVNVQNDNSKIQPAKGAMRACAAYIQLKISWKMFLPRNAPNLIDTGGRSAKVNSSSTPACGDCIIFNHAYLKLAQ